VEVEKLLGRATDALSVGRAFGPAIERDGTLIIPVAWVAGGGGAGGGDVSAQNQANGDDSPRHGNPDGGGGGFGGFTWPLGVFVVKNGDVRWVPALDVTRVALAGIALIRTVAKLSAVRRAKSPG